MLTPRTTWLLGAVLLLIFVAFAWVEVPPAVTAAQGGYLAFSDFFAQWSFARFARSEHVALIYDADVLHRFQITLEPALRQTFPFPYPPGYLFAIWPLGWLSYGTAYVAWDAATLGFFLWAVFGTRLRTPAVWFVLLAPITILALIQGQNGLLTSALIVSGMRLMRDRPVLGGLLLGLATIKPQLGTLVPLALIGAGYWRTLATAALTAMAVAITSSLIFGLDIWPAWLSTLPGHAAYLDRSVNNYLKPTIMANLVLFGMAVPVAHAVQAGVGLVVAAIVFLCFRRGPSDLSIAVLQVGTFLAIPYVFRYDMPMQLNGILLMTGDRARSRRSVGPIEAGIVVLGLLAPALNTVTTRFFYVAGVSSLLLFGLAVWWRLQEKETTSLPAVTDRSSGETSTPVGASL